ncbi:MAG: M24 family metallopeptidase, partial [Patescibacteria group bacterium]
MIARKTTEEIEILAEAGELLARFLREIAAEAVPGVATIALDDRAMELCEAHNVTPILLGYHPGFATSPYPAAVCISVNDCVQHGIPSEEKFLVAGDVVNIDMSIEHQGLVVDAGITVGVGEISVEARKLLAVTEAALAKGVQAAQPGQRIG